MKICSSTLFINEIYSVSANHIIDKCYTDTTDKGQDNYHTSTLDVRTEVQLYRRQRLRCSRRRYNSKWCHILFSDSFRFILLYSDTRSTVYRNQDERFNNQCVGMTLQRTMCVDMILYHMKPMRQILLLMMVHSQL